MRRPTHKNTCLSAIQAHARPPNARTSKKTLKYTDIVVNSMILTSQALGSKSIYAENKEVVTTVTTKGTVHSLARFTHVHGYSLQLFLMVCRKGGPTLSTIPEKMYWKHDIRKRVVFSEFSIFDFSVFNRGGMNLRRSVSTLHSRDALPSTYQACRCTYSKAMSCAIIHSDT